MKDFVVRGIIYHDGKMVSGTYSVLEEKFIESSSRPDAVGTLIRAPINFHTHLGDSFINSEPEGDIEQIVGPNGLKAKALSKSPPSLVRKWIKRSIDFMKDNGTAAFFDFRESGVNGLNMIPRFAGIDGYFLTRPIFASEIQSLLDKSSGFGMSAISDYDFLELKNLAEQAHARGKIFAIHFSENKRESIRDLIQLRPDYVVHCIEASEEDLEVLKRSNIPITITPRSNVFHGKRPDYSRFFRKGLTVLLGTDNVFITEPAIMEEVEFLYRYQRKLNRITPEEALSTVIDNPRRVISKLGLKMNQERFILFPSELLTAYQIVTRPNYFRSVSIAKKENRITFFARKHW